MYALYPYTNLCYCLVTQSCQILQTPWTAAHQAPRPWDSPGKNTGVGCHFLLQCIKVKNESEGAQSCPTLNDPMDCSPPGSSVHGIFQARVLEWGAITFSRKGCCSMTTPKAIYLRPHSSKTRETWGTTHQGVGSCHAQWWCMYPRRMGSSKAKTGGGGGRMR